MLNRNGIGGSSSLYVPGRGVNRRFDEIDSSTDLWDTRRSGNSPGNVKMEMSALNGPSERLKFSDSYMQARNCSWFPNRSCHLAKACH